MPTAADYLEQLKTLLPPGQAFPREAGTALNNLLDGMSLELAREDARGESLPVEANPASTNELLPDWERVVGLPDRCSGALEETIQGRKKALIVKLTSTGAQSVAWMASYLGSWELRLISRLIVLGCRPSKVAIARSVCP